jgi:hypothetical protein
VQDTQPHYMFPQQQIQERPNVMFPQIEERQPNVMFPTVRYNGEMA